GGRHRHVEGALTTGVSRAQHVQTHPCHHCRQPRLQVFHTGGVGAFQPQPRFLHRVLGFGCRSEHAVGRPTQPWPLLLEPEGQQLSILHDGVPPRPVQVTIPAVNEAITGATYTRGNGMWEYHCARITVMTAPVKYSTRATAAAIPSGVTSSPPSSPTAPRDLAVPSQGHHVRGTP